MHLPGRLRLTTLGDVLGTVYRESARGAIELTESHGPRAGSVHRVHIVAGLVAHVETHIATARLGEVLLRLGLASEVSLLRLAGRIPLFPHMKAGEILVLGGAVTPSDVAHALRIQRRERLERLFSLDDARLAFRVACESKESRESPLYVDAGEYLHGRPRSRDRGHSPSQITARRRDPIRTRALSTLGLSEAADATSVQRAFRQLAMTMHPDRFPTVGAAERSELMRKFAEITAAYHALVA
jgi:hypothetical protein